MFQTYKTSKHLKPQALTKKEFFGLVNSLKNWFILKIAVLRLAINVLCRSCHINIEGGSLTGAWHDGNMRRLQSYECSAAASLMSECPAQGVLENKCESYWPWLLIDWFNRFLKRARYNILNTSYFETPWPVPVCGLRACGQVTVGPGADKAGARVQCPSASVSPPQWQHRPVVSTPPQQ